MSPSSLGCRHLVNSDFLATASAPPEVIMGAAEASLSWSGELCIGIVNERKCGAEPIQGRSEDDVGMAEGKDTV